MPFTPQVAVNLVNSELLNWMETFLFDKRSTRLSQNTIDYYRYALTHFVIFCTSSGVSTLGEITANVLRRYLLYLENKGYNAGGVHAKWRAVRAFLNWYAIEELDFINPAVKIRVKMPNMEPLNPADIEVVKDLLNSCDNSFTGKRDRLILLMLLDTGLRASELLGLTIDNINSITGVIQVVHGKGEKPRTVYMSRKTRRQYRQTITHEGDVFLNVYGDKLTRSGLMQMLKRRAKLAGVPYQSAHSFRRLFALTMLRNGVDVFSLALIMGHSDIQILRRYLKVINSDTQKAHLQGSPVEKWIK